MRHLTLSVFLLLIFIFGVPLFNSAPALATGTSSQNFFDLDLSELSNIIVTVASTGEESIPGTPALVSRYNADEMSKLGLRTLKDMLSFIPGIVVQDSASGNTPIMIRGIVEAFNQKVLFLIDDVPYFMPAHSDVPLLGVPLEAISHIEVIRGPGAVYYGTNASAGVIKVVTKKYEEQSVSVSGGSNSLVNLGGRFMKSFGQGNSLSLAFEVQEEDGYDGRFENIDVPPTYPPGTPTAGNLNKEENFRTVMARLQLGDFQVLGQAHISKVNGISGAGSLINLAEIEYKGYLAHLAYGHRFGKVGVKAYSDYNVFYPTFDIDNFLGGVTPGQARFDDSGRDNFRWRSGATVNFDWTDRLQLFGGAEYEKRSTGSYDIYNQVTNVAARNVIAPNSMEEISVFGQIDYTFLQLRFLIGARYTDNNYSGQELTPRIATIYKIDPRQSVKLLYSEGFNVPNFVQLGANSSGLVATAPNLVAETVETTDLAYTFASKHNLFVANAYFLKAKDFIQRRRPGGVITFFNASNFERYGAEFDYQHQREKWKLFANLAYHHQGDDRIAADETALFTPQLTFNLGGFYQVGGPHSMGGSLRLIGPRAGASSLTLVNLDYRYALGDFELFATLRNLLDETIQHPDVQNFNEDSLIPAGDGINFLAGLRYSIR